MDFAELLAMLQSPPEDGLPDTIYDDLNTAYTNDLSIRDAKVNEHGERLQAANEEIARLKSANYDLLIAQPGKEPETPEETEDEESSAGIDSLFESKDDN